MAIKNGTSGNDTINGTASNDIIDGKSGYDTLFGRLGKVVHDYMEAEAADSSSNDSVFDLRSKKCA